MTALTEEKALKPTKNLYPHIHLQWFASAEDEGRTEAPSDLKLRKAREEGRVPKSQELTGGLVLLLPVLTLVLLAPWLLNGFVQIIRYYMERCTTANITDGELMVEFLYSMVRMVLPIAATAIVAGVVANVIQNKGFIFTTKTIEPKISKILPKFGEYFKKTLFSFEGAFNVVKSIVKVAVIFIAAYLLIRSDVPHLLTLMNTNFWDGIVFISEMTAKLLIITSVIFIIIAIPDYIVQRKQFMESMKMTKQEVKQEYKETEGDPLVKSKLRQYMHEMLRRNIPAAVAKSDVVITNPTHYAVAIQYDSATMAGPMVTAKGVDSLARRIREIAAENKVPLVENRPLARALYAEVEIGEMVPENYYQALAVILANVYNAKGK
ncbi:MAG: flagellar biosynthesis protein FlhB [Spirochaetaceae bacterium]|nr:flagellar biosynthesis protein FlhB [Spirochaetaceae bacterium]